MHISGFRFLAVLSFVSVIVALPIEGRTPVAGIDRRQPDDSGVNVIGVVDHIADALGLHGVGVESPTKETPAKGSQVEVPPVAAKKDRRKRDGVDGVDDSGLLGKIEGAVEAILSKLGLSKDHVPVTKDKCHDLGDKDLLDQILKAINSILKDLGIKEVKFIPLTEDKSGDLGDLGHVLDPIEDLINGILGGCGIPLVEFVLAGL